MKSIVIKDLTPEEALFEFLACQIDALRPQFIPRDAVLRGNALNDCGQREHYAIVQLERVERVTLTETQSMWRFNVKVVLCARLASGARVLNALGNALIRRLEPCRKREATIVGDFEGKRTRALCYCGAVERVEYRPSTARFQSVLTLSCDVYFE